MHRNHKYATPRTEWPLNVALEKKMDQVYDLLRQNRIADQLEAAKELVENYYGNYYYKVGIPISQFGRLKQLIKNIKKATPTNPMAQVIHAIFTARRATESSAEDAQKEYDQIHQQFPDNIVAYQKHIALSKSMNQAFRVLRLEENMAAAFARIRKNNPDNDLPPLNAYLKAKMEEIINLGKNDIDDQLEAATELVEKYFIQKYNGESIPDDQFAELNRLMFHIRYNTPPVYPLAQLIHAMFTARKGGQWIQAAEQEYDDIHQKHPDYLPAYAKHIKLRKTLQQSTTRLELEMEAAEQRLAIKSRTVSEYASPAQTIALAYRQVPIPPRPDAIAEASARYVAPPIPSPVAKTFKPTIGAERFKVFVPKPQVVQQKSNENINPFQSGFGQICRPAGTF